jgi:hypothetical protein
VISTLLAEAASCDGVVPTRSQTLNGIAERVVLADHLDVVGSFAGGGQITDITRSAAAFDSRSFEALWGDIAWHLATEDGESDTSTPQGERAVGAA